MVCRIYFTALFVFLLMLGKANYCAVIVISIPKSGTHLVGKLLDLLDFKCAGSSFKGTYLHFDETKIKALRDNEYSLDHAIASDRNIQTLKEVQHKVLFIYRDPRDQILSLMHYMKKHRKGIWSAEQLNDYDFTSRIISDYSLLSQTYKKPSHWSDPILDEVGSVADFYNLYLPWMRCSNIYIVSFEKLIGSKGGGDSEVQADEIRNICNFLGLSLKDEDIKNIVAKLFGGVFTFHKGQIGSWKKQFAPEHIKLFKEYAGQLLIDLGYEQDLNW